MESWTDIIHELDAAQFENQGNSPDEIILEFGEGTLYVSKHVLIRASPVFRSMFEHDCKEKEEGKVNIDDIDIEDFNQFLLCIDPGCLNDLNGEKSDILVHFI